MADIPAMKAAVRIHVRAERMIEDHDPAEVPDL